MIDKTIMKLASALHLWVKTFRCWKITDVW